MDSVHSTPDAQSTPHSMADSHGALLHDQELTLSDRPQDQTQQMIETGRSSLTNPSTCSSAVIYKMKAHGNRGDRSPTRIEFNRVKRVPDPARGFFLFHKNETRYKYTDVSRLPPKKKEKIDCEKTKTVKTIKQHTNNKKAALERVELYYFDHGNSDYFYTTDSPPQLLSDRLAHQTNETATKFWAECYGSIHIVIAIIIAFVLQTFRFCMYSVVRPLLVGFVQITADYGVKPFLAVVFNGILQPPLILGLNVLNSMADMFEPLARTVGHFVRPCAELLQAIRLVEIAHYHQRDHDPSRDEDQEGVVKNVQVEVEDI